MKKNTYQPHLYTIVLVIFIFIAVPVTAQFRGYWHGKERELRYTPEGEDFVIVNGDRKFNRALYGTHTGFRVETGDLPEFGLYMPNMGGNMQLGVISGGKSKWLNDAEYIKSIYRPGSRIYEISDPLIGNIRLTVLAMGNAEGMIIKIETQQLHPDMELFWSFGGAGNQRFSREGDLGVDAPDCFALKPEACANNIFSLSGQTFDLYYGNDRKIVEAAVQGNFDATSDSKKKARVITGTFPDGSQLKLSSPYSVTTPSDMWKSQVTDNKPVLTGRCKIDNGKEYYFAIQNKLSLNTQYYSVLPQIFGEAESARSQIAGTIRINTPDPYFNTLGGALSIAAEGIWEPDSWLHGAVGWRMRLNGWRAAYTGDVMGWHDRARGHFDGYAASQTTGVEPVIPHPSQDSALNLARARKKWGTQMYSNGYICRNPNQTGVMHHYDMNLCYIDELLWHFNWTGDMDYIRKMWPVLERHLAWEKRNFDPDNDGLYDAYCCIWASDALYYNSGGVTHSSAYNYRANRMAAEIAGKIGKDPKPYQDEADKILKAVNSALWLSKLGRWAEFKDFMGHKRVHPDAAVWTIYHAIDSEIHDPFQAYQATRYIDTEIPHIPVRARGLRDDGYATVSTTNWLPYAWSVNNVAFAEANHTALAYWQSGRYEEGFKLLKSSVLDGMYLSSSPGNFGQVSFYDAARGECYRDFGDPVGITSRAIVQGLFGIAPDAMNHRWVIRPGFPETWEHASIVTPDISFAFQREGNTDNYIVENLTCDLELLLKARADQIVSLTVNGKKSSWTLAENAAGYPLVKIDCSNASSGKYHIQVEWGRGALQSPQYPATGVYGETWQLNSSNKIVKLYDPQSVLVSPRQNKNSISGRIAGEKGHRTLFIQLEQGQMKWWQPIPFEVIDRYRIVSFDPEAASLNFAVQNNTSVKLSGTLVVNPGEHAYMVDLNILPGGQSGIIDIPHGKVWAGTNKIEIWAHGKLIYQTSLVNWNVKNKVSGQEIVDISDQINAPVTQIFRNEYLSPRSPYTTLQIPKQGIGEWCHPLITAVIDDSGLKASSKDGLFPTPFGVSFGISPDRTDNIIFTSLWDNYPDKVIVPLSGKASHAYLMMAGSTNHMQCHMVNAMVTVEYTDGSSEKLELINPETWAPIEQDFYTDGYAFSLKAPRPYRIHLKSGLVSRDLEKDLNIKGVYGRAIDGGAGIILDIPVDNRKELRHLSLETIANEVVVGLMGITLVK